MIALILVLPFIYLFFPSTAFAQVVINEVFPNPEGEEDGAEWVELFNTGSEVVSLKDCVLYLHAENNNQNVVFGDESFVDEYEVISWSESWLNNSGDQVRLVCSGFNDTVSYGNISGSQVGVPKEDVSIGRSPNGSGSFQILASVTMGEANSLPPTPTQEPTDTSIPTQRPTNAPTAKPTVKPTSAPTGVTKKVSPTQTEVAVKNEEREDEAPVLGIQESRKEKKEENESTDALGSNFKIIAPSVLILLGGFLIVASIYIFIRGKKQG